MSDSGEWGGDVRPKGWGREGGFVSWSEGDGGGVVSWPRGKGGVVSRSRRGGHLIVVTAVLCVLGSHVRFVGSVDV